MSIGNKCIHHYFEQQVAKTPDNIALEFYDDSLTYDELNRKANQVAHVLQDSGVINESLVAICVERSMEQIVGILAILKAGATYVPIDPSLPKHKIDIFLNDINADIILTHNQTINHCTDHHIINLDDLATNHSFNLPIAHSDSDLAYIIYTSGSTGQPKGVMVEHSSVLNLIEAQKYNFNISLDRILLVSEIFFDASIEQIFLALLSGSTLICLNHTTLKDIDKLEDYIQDKKITHLHGIPSLLSQLDQKIANMLRRIVSGGECCPASLANKWIGVCDFYNEYGPTETTCTSVMAKLSHPVERLVPIGKPLSNIECFVVKDNALVAGGEEGELWIAGQAVARGYLRLPKLTQENFIMSLFNGKRAYKTGDICRWTRKGDLEFLRRSDLQVKVRGYRIELQEIETVILTYPEIENCIVTLSNEVLVAHCKGTINGLRSYLKTQLADYMIPTHIIKLQQFPVTCLGKIDRKALQKKHVNLHETSLSSTEGGIIRTKLVKIWQEVLMIETFNESDNFYDAGGNSLRAMQAVIKIRQIFKVNMEMSYFINNPYINKCIDYLVKYSNYS